MLTIKEGEEWLYRQFSSEDRSELKYFSLGGQKVWY
jgi:hypothetical protein